MKPAKLLFLALTLVAFIACKSESNGVDKGADQVFESNNIVAQEQAESRSSTSQIVHKDDKISPNPNQAALNSANANSAIFANPQNANAAADGLARQFKNGLMKSLENSLNKSAIRDAILAAGLLNLLEAAADMQSDVLVALAAEAVAAINDADAEAANSAMFAVFLKRFGEIVVDQNLQADFADALAMAEAKLQEILAANEVLLAEVCQLIQDEVDASAPLSAIPFLDIVQDECRNLQI